MTPDLDPSTGAELPAPRAGRPEPLDADAVRTAVQAALEEDLGSGDLTSLGAVPEAARAAARLVAKEAGVVAGLDLFVCAFELRDPEARVTRRVDDGDAPRSCSVPNAAGTACESGACRIARCEIGFEDCNGQIDSTEFAKALPLLGLQASPKRSASALRSLTRTAAARSAFASSASLSGGRRPRARGGRSRRIWRARRPPYSRWTSPRSSTR